MIDEDRTLSVLGVEVSKLSKGSNQKVFAVCDGCGKYRKQKYREYRDLCKSCCRKGKLNHGYRKPVSIETRQKLSNANRGKHPSDEARKKMSRSHTGRPGTMTGKRHSEETKQKMSELNSGERNHFYGKHHSVETRRKLAEAHCGTHHTEESIKKMSDVKLGKRWSDERRDAVSGENSHLWQGGWSFGKYCSLFNRTFRELIRNRYNRRCFICGSTENDNGKKLSVHHVNYYKNCLCDNVKCEFVPLCGSCHSATNHHRQYWEDVIMCCLHPTRAWLPDI